MAIDIVGSPHGAIGGAATHSTFEGTGHEIGVSNHLVKVIEVLAESPHSWEDAARVALREATRSLRNIASVYIKDLQAIVRDGHVAAWRVNAKISFVVSDQDQNRTETQNKREETTMRNRQEQGRPYRGESQSFPEYEEYGLHGDERREYRGRESYEQQSRGGQGGRSGMWNQRYMPREYDERYRNNADEDRRGYQNLGYRQEFESSGRGHDYDEPRYGFDSRDYGRGSASYDRWESQDFRRGDDYSRTDYGERGYGNRNFGPRDYPSRDYYSREYGNPYSRRSTYEDPYDAPQQRSGYNLGGRGYGARSSGNFPEQGEQQRFGQGEGSYGQRRGPRGPKGYKRSDERIREDVCDRLSQHWDLDASEIEVSVNNGEVTLAGTISDRDQKFRAENIADGVGGVTEVHNQLRVRRDMGAQATPQTGQTPRAGSTNQTRSS
jgi:flavin-binding protein dodecin